MAVQLLYYSYLIFFFSFFLSFFLFFLSFFSLSPTSFYLTMVGVEGFIALDRTKGHTTVGRTPLDEGSAR
jgi:hypothetical protein